MLQEVTNISSAILFRIQPHRTKLLRLAVALGMLIAGPIVGVLVVRMNWQYVLIATLAPLVLLVLPRLDLSPLVILATAAFVRFSLSTGTGSPLVASLLVSMFFVGAWVLKMLTVDKRLWLEPSKVNRPLLGSCSSHSFRWSGVLHSEIRWWSSGKVSLSCS